MRPQMPRRSGNPFEHQMRDLLLEIGIVVAAVLVSAALMAIAYGAAA
jgi:hypothetical protein